MKAVNRRDFLKTTGLGAVSLGLPGRLGAATAGPAGKPNIIFVFADQMRFCEMGCAGNKAIRTPNLDRLASQGAILSNAFSCTPLCTPYRAQLITGRYGPATTLINNDIHLPDNEITIAKVLKAQGYATGYIGKWHMDGGRRAKQGDPRLLGYVPPKSRQGFDFWAARECNHQYFDTFYFRDTPNKVPAPGYEPTVQTNLAVDFISRNKEKPFLLMVAFGPPHDPYKPPARFDTHDPQAISLRPNVPAAKAGAARVQIAKYWGQIESLDREVGRIMAAVDAAGIAGNTILCFSSDHGDMHYSQGQLKKQRPWEESAHIPFLMRYPEKMAPGKSFDFPFGSVDVMPTLLGFAGAPIPAAVQGTDVSALLLGKTAKEPDAVFLANYARGGTGGKLAPWRAIRTKEWLFALSAENPQNEDWLLYDMKNDPYQMKNLVANAAFGKTKELLRTRLMELRRKNKDIMDIASTVAGKPA